jgi:hypothetical protein
MERCLTCGAALAPWRYNVCCPWCAEALLEAFLARDWGAPIHQRVPPAGESQGLGRSACPPPLCCP